MERIDKLIAVLDEHGYFVTYEPSGDNEGGFYARAWRAGGMVRGEIPLDPRINAVTYPTRREAEAAATQQLLHYVLTRHKSEILLRQVAALDDAN